MNKIMTSFQKRRIQSGGFAGTSSALTRWGISSLEAGLCAVIVIGCILLHFVPAYNKYGLGIEIGLSLISFAKPISGLLYLSAAQVIPDPPGIPLSSAEMALAGFFLWQLAAGKIMDLVRMGRPLLMVVAPFFVWGAGCSWTHGDYRFGAYLLFAILTGCAVAALVGQSGNRLAVCLISFLTGQALAMCLFWIVNLHLGEPTRAYDTEMFGELNGRLGTARGNANTLGPPMALVCIGAIGWFINRPKKSWMVEMAALASLALAIPPLIGSGCRGAFVSLAVGVVFLVGMGVLAHRSFAYAPLALGGILLVLVLGWQRLGLNEHWQEMSGRQLQQHEEQGTIFAGRAMSWTAAWRDILDSPIIGPREDIHLSQLSQDAAMSHSVYLDAGLAGGVPGMALFGWLVLTPILKLWRRRFEPVIGWLLAVYVVSIISIGSTSAMQLKHFWMLWGMAAVCFLPAVAPNKSRSKRAARRMERSGQRAEGQMSEDNSQIQISGIKD
jgi:O-antigen ligase